MNNTLTMLFHKLWGQVASKEYKKKDWIETQKEIDNMSNISLAGMSKEERSEAYMSKRVGDYCPTPEAHGHPTPTPTFDGPGRQPANSGEWDAYWAGNWPPKDDSDDGPLTERSPSVNPELHEVDLDVSEFVSLFSEPLTAGAIYLVKRPHVPGQVLEPMFLRVYQDDMAVFQDMVGERLTMGTNLARECIQKRYLTKDILEALAKTV